MSCRLVFVRSLDSLLILFDIIVTEAVIKDQSPMVDAFRQLIFSEELGDKVAHRYLRVAVFWDQTCQEADTRIRKELSQQLDVNPLHVGLMLADEIRFELV